MRTCKRESRFIVGMTVLFGPSEYLLASPLGRRIVGAILSFPSFSFLALICFREVSQFTLSIEEDL